MDSNCGAWHSGNSEVVGLAGSLQRGQLLAQERYSCTHRLAVLCIEVTSQTSSRRRREVAEEAEKDDSGGELSEPEYRLHLENLLHEV